MRKIGKKLISFVVSAAMIVQTSLALMPLPVKAETTSIFTDYLPTIEEVIDSSGFKHPGVGLTKDILENLRTKVRAQAEPWNTYFNVMCQSYAAATNVSSSNQSSADPTQPASRAFNSKGIQSKFISDALKAFTQALMYYITGNEVYRANAMHIIRIWSQMDPAQYAYYSDAHIHTGIPLYRMVMAAEILRYTSCQTDSLKWTDKDTVDFTNNLIIPVIETFQHDQNHFMNQHTFPLLGAMAGYIFTGNRDRYNEAVEWFTVNSTANDQGFNGSVKQLFRWVDEIQVPGIKVGEGIPVQGQVQLIEMGRDQAHAGCDLQNAVMISRMLLAQGTKVDPVTGTVSTADDAVGPYEFLNDRILAAADYFWRYMLGYDTPWIPVAYAISPDGTIRDTYNYISPSYRGRYANDICWDLYSYYTYVKHENVAEKAPYFYEAFTKKPKPTTGDWESVDGGHDFWLYLPPEAEADAAAWLSQDRSTGTLYEVEDRFTKLDNNTTAVQEGDTAFVRFYATEAGSKIVYLSSRLYSTAPYGLRIRTNGVATLNTMGQSLVLPDTKGEWKYVVVTGCPGDFTEFVVKGLPGTVVDIDHINAAAGTQLTPPVFKAGSSDLNVYTYVGASVNIDFSATDTSSTDVITYGIQNNPDGSSIDAGTGAFSWHPAKVGNFSMVVTATDGTTITAKNVNIIVCSDRASAVQAIIASYDPNEVYVEATLKNFQKVYSDTMSQINTASDEAFDKQLQALVSATESLELVTPLAQDGSMRWSSVAYWSSWGSSAPYMDDCNNQTGGWYGLALGSPPHLYHIIDFGPDYKISAYRFGFQSNIFVDRLANSTVYGSNDGKNWTRLTPGVTAYTQDYQTLDVDPAYQNEKYRFIKLEMIQPLPDVLHGIVRNLLELTEFRIYGTRYEIGNKIESVSLSSDQSINGKVSIGDTIKLMIKAKEPIKNVKVTIQGIDATVTTTDNINWIAEVTPSGKIQTGEVEFTLDYQKNDGTNGDTIYTTTDNSKLYLVDGSKFINVSRLATVTASDNQWPGNGLSKEQVGYLLFDGDVTTAGDLNSGSGSYYTVDFGEGASVKLEEIALMPRVSYSERMNGLVVQGSNDNVNWVDLTKPLSGAKESTWSFITADQIIDHNYYRYLRLYNSSAWYGNVAEVEFYGDIDYNLDYVDAKVLAPDGYTKGSYYLYCKEIERIKAAMSQPGADKTALLNEFLQAKELLVPDITIMNKIPVTRDMVVASANAWDNTANAADNGWRAFDGDINTATDTATPNGWIRVDLGAGNEKVIGLIRFYPRNTKSDHINRINGSVIQGSNDGTNWINLYTISGINTANWYTANITENTAFRYLRYLDEHYGSTNVAELEFYEKVCDKTLLEILLNEADSIETELYTDESVQVLQQAVSSARLVFNNINATQEEIDEAAANLKTAIEGLQLKPNFVELKGTSEITKGQVFTQIVSVKEMERAAAFDTTILYDSSKFEYIEVEEVDSRSAILAVHEGEYSSESGIRMVRVITACPGESNLITGEADIFAIKFRALDNPGTGAISVHKSIVANTSGNETELGQCVKEITVEEGINKAQLIEAIENAQSIYDEAVEGTGIGQYPAGSKDEILKPAIEKA